MRAFPADFYKVVSTATTLSDNVAMIQFLGREADNHSLVGLCMGEQGIISRVLGVRAGSVFTFASASAGEETAPGQATAQELRSVYRIETSTPPPASTASPETPSRTRSRPPS